MVNRYLQLLRQFGSLTRACEPILFTGQCIVCGNNSHRALDICQACEDELPWSEHQCKRCAITLVDTALATGSEICGQCLQSPPVFQRAFAVWLYQPPIAQLISAFKYQRRYSIGRVLSTLAAQQLTSAYSPLAKPDFLLATPLHWRRHFQRGFNQSEHVCSYLSSALDIPVLYGTQRIKATPPQQTLDLQQRQHNVIGAFSINNATAAIRNRCIAVVDDVVTTGATANELSQCLLNAGAREVHIWCLAKTPL